MRKARKTPPPKKNNPKKNTPKKNKGKLKVLVASCLGVLTVMCFLMVVFLYDMPSINNIKPPTRSPCIIVKSQEGVLLATYGDFFRKPVKASELPTYIPQAIISIEDKRFFEHFGVDVLGLIRAFWVNIKSGRYAQGGSTITQQLAKNAFLSPERSIKRKIQEAVLAIWLERRFSKNQILSMYLNRVYFGSGTYGIDAAAWKFFQKPANNLTLYEAVKLAAVLKSPVKYSPFNNPDAADVRAIKVLVSMINAGYITQAQAERAINNHRESLRPSAHGGEGYRYFTDWVVESAQRLIPLTNDDLVINTTLSYKMQIHAEAVITKYASDCINKLKQDPTQVAFICADSTGAVKAMVGGLSYRESQFNRVIAGRQSGSIFKMFVFLSALESGMKPYDQISDLPLKLGSWSPKNYHWASRGSVSMKDAFAFSINTATVRLAQKVGIKNVVDLAQALGISTRIPLDLTVALGSGNTSLFDLVDAYNIINTKGVRIPAYAINSITNSKGKVLYKKTAHKHEKILPDGVISNMKDMLKGVMEYGTGKKSQLAIKSFGKTGTSNKGRDAWFIGGANSLIAGVWCGHDDMRETKNLGGTASAKIWKDFISACVGLTPYYGINDIPKVKFFKKKLNSKIESIDELINQYEE